MRIVNLKEFRTLSAGTLFAKYEPCAFGAIMVKGETWEHDFLYENIADAIDCTDSGDFADKLFDAEENGTSILVDFDSTSRDGCFEDEQLFAIYEKKDVEMLIDKLGRCIGQAYAPKEDQ